jgi:Na+:H+ antiporter, NhaA family
MSHDEKKPNGLIQFLFGNSLFLISGTILALVWANVDAQVGTHTHHQIFHADLVELVTGKSGSHDGDHADETHADGAHADGDHADEHAASGHSDESHSEGTPSESGPAAGEPQGSEAAPADGSQSEKSDQHAEKSSGAHHGLTLHFLINDVLMALFFGMATKEVWESLLPGGALSNPRKAATPLLATLGGVVGPAIVYSVGVLMFSEWSVLGRGWAIPCATDIAFSYLVARIIFGNGHPAIAFLLLLAIADDAAGLVILAIFYPSAPLEPMWLLLSAGAMVTGVVFKKLRLQSFWWYLLIPGAMSWTSFYMAGVHPALGLVPIIPTLPHAKSDLGIFAVKELGRHDTLSEFEHFFKNPTEVLLGFFGLCNAAVGFSNVGVGTWLVLAGLIIGKPVGITLLTMVAEKVFRLQIPAGMTYAHVVTLGCVAGIGFTVALFVSTAAFTEPGPTLDSVKMGALGSFGAAVVAFVVAKVLGVKPTGAVVEKEAEAH